MRLKIAFLALIFSLLAFGAQKSFAETLTLTGVGGANSDGVYTYPYLFTVTGPGGTSTNVLMSCLNFDREIFFNETWTVNMVSVLSIGSSGLDGETQKAYIEDAWLYNQYATASLQKQSDLQFAIWEIMDPAVAGMGLTGYDANAASLDAQALAFYNAGNYSSLANDVVFVPVAGGWPAGDGEPQIFMVNPAPPAATPEPSSLFLLGTGLMATVAVMRRKMMSTA